MNYMTLKPMHCLKGSFQDGNEGFGSFRANSSLKNPPAYCVYNGTEFETIFRGLILNY